MDIETALCTIADHYYSNGARDGWNRALAEKEPVPGSRRPPLRAFKEAMAFLNEMARQPDEQGG